MKPTHRSPLLLERARQTFRWDLLRGGCHGILETTWQTFALLVAIRVFGAEDTLKSFLPAAFGIGLILNPLILSMVGRTRMRIGNLLALYALGGGTAFGFAVLTQDLLGYIALVVLAQIFFAQTVPLMTQVYSENYKGTERGKRFAVTAVIGSLVGIVVSSGGGKLLDLDLGFYRLLFLLCFLAGLGSALAYHRMPTQTMQDIKVGNPWSDIPLIWRDRVFGWMLAGWMLMGLGNLMTLPIRVEYMANPLYGINATNAQVGLILGAIPLTFRILSTLLWGALFDRWNMITMRIVLNLFFLLSVVLYFSTESLVLMGLSTALLGMAMGGGGIIWQLWVTKVAPPGKVSSYMSIHGATTGLRAAAAPFLGYFLLVQFSPGITAVFAGLLIACSTVIFIPLYQQIQERGNNAL